MKKLILPTIFFFTLLVLLPGFPLASGQVNAQTKGPLSCEEMEKVMDSPECPHWTIRELGMWCAQSLEEILYVPADTEDGTEPIWRVRPPDYTLLSDDMSCSLKDSTKPEQNLKPRGFDIPDVWAIDVSDISDWLIPFVGTIGFDTVASPEQIQGITGIDIKKLLDREPSISPALEKEAWPSETDEFSVPLKFKDPEKDQVRIVKGQGELVPDDFYEKVIIIDPGPGTQQLAMVRINSFAGATSKLATFRYTWSPDSGAVINASPKTEIKFLKPVQDAKTQELKRMVKLNRGELEVKVKQANKKEKFGVQTDFLDLYVIGTHFWVTHDPDKKYTLVGVYEGNVEVTTKDGKTTTITPDGDKPGIVVVSQKLSIMKLALAGLILAAVIAGGVLFFKRKGIK